MNDAFDSEFCCTIEEEIDLWTAEFKKYFQVFKVQSYAEAIEK